MMKSSQSTFSSCMHDQMLESNRDDVKLEAMRCITVMTAKGRLTLPRTLFPYIVKNLSSKNPELKKLIYLYLTSFADQEPDLALLPVATLQKSLKSPNPLMRSSALKVLTSMRLNILSAILMATIRNSVNDLSPYVRKTVAHAIIKLYRLDPSLKPDLVEYVERLFNDKNSMVLSSAIATYEVLCPERLDLVHKQYRRFCFILADCNEWGQTLFVNLLMRYVLKTFSNLKPGSIPDFDPTEHDPKILLRSAKPLLHSNNSAVVMAVIKLFIAIANHTEVRSTITKPLIRLLYSHREIQLCVLKMIEDLIKPQEEDDMNKEVVNEDKTLDQDEVKLAENEAKVIEDKTVVENVKVVEDEAVLEEVKVKEDNNKMIENHHEEVIDDHKDTVGKSKEGEDNNEVGLEGEEQKQKQEDSEDGDEEVEDEDEGDEDEDEEEEDEDEEEEEEEEEEETDDSSAEATDNNNEVSGDLGAFDLSLIDLKTRKNPKDYQEVFRPYIKSFYIKHSDCTQIRIAKLKILTNLCSSINVTQVLKELQAYILSYVDDKEFVSAVIHAIGRCALSVREVAHTCLMALTSLLSNNNEHVVSDAIVVLRSQIMSKRPKISSADGADSSTILNGEGDAHATTGMNSNDAHDAQASDNDSQLSDDENIKTNEKMVSTVIKQVSRLLPKVTAPQARATILWILAEFCDKNLAAAKCAPEVLRSIAKSFCQEDSLVKLQVLTLVTKFLISLEKNELYQKIQLLAGYLFSLAKYDINHDVRDRGRFLKKLLEDEELCSKVLNVRSCVKIQPSLKV